MTVNLDFGFAVMSVYGITFTNRRNPIMNSRTYYYARVSSKEQNLDRQIAAFLSLGAEERDIITDKESGKNLDRAGYQAL